MMGKRVRAIKVDGHETAITALQDTWVSQDEWWRPQAIDRQYYAVVLETGKYLTIFLDRLTGTWYQQHHDQP